MSTPGRFPAVRNKRFVVYALGATISAIGNQFNVLALSVYLYQVGGSLGPVAYMWIARVLSRLLVQPLSGAYVDRWDKKRTLIGAELASTLVVLGFLFVNRANLWLAYVLTFALQTAEGFASPAIRSALPQILDKEALASGNALLRGLGKVSSFAGPAVAGLLYAHVGAKPLFVANAVSFLPEVAAALPLTFRSVPSKMTEQRLVRAVVAGFKYAVTSPLVAVILVASIVNSLVLRVLEIALIPGSQDLFGLGVGGLGFLYSAITVGGLVGAFVAPSLKRAGGDLRTVILAYGALAVPLAGVGLSWNAASATVALIAVGLVTDVAAVLTATALQRNVPQDMLGRTFSLVNVALALGVLPGLIGLAPLTNLVGLRGIFLGAASLTLVSTVAVGAWTVCVGTAAKSLPQ